MIPLLLLAFFTAFSGSAFSYTPHGLDLNPRDYDYLQADQNTTALFFEEISISNTLQVVTKNNLSNGNLFFEFSTLFLLAEQSSALKNNSEYLQDKRNMLEHQIFPFHFFW